MKIIVFEGIDASGKETQSKLLYQALVAEGYLTYYASFPRYETPIGKLIKQHLTGEIELTNEAFHMLLEADRVDFMGVIENLKSQGYEYVVLDRFTLSNIVFGNAKGIDTQWLLEMQEKVTVPDLTFFIDIPVEVSEARRPQGRDKHEQDTALLSKARELYTNFAKLHPNIELINGNRPIENIFDEIWEAVFQI